MPKRSPSIKDDFIVSVAISAVKEAETTQKVIRDTKSSSSYKNQLIVIDQYFNDGTEKIVEEEKFDFVSESE